MDDAAGLIGSAEKAAHPLYISVHIKRVRLDLPWNLTSDRSLHVDAKRAEDSPGKLDIQLSLYPVGTTELKFFYELEPDLSDPRLKYFIDAACKFGMPTLPASWVDMLEYLRTPRSLSEVELNFPGDSKPSATLSVMERSGAVDYNRSNDLYQASKSKIVATLGGYKRRAE